MHASEKKLGWSRRSFLQQSALAGAAGAASTLLPGTAKASSSPVSTGPNIYEAIGVRPLINCKGMYTIISGSQSLPGVKKAMEEASRHYVNLDEPMRRSL